MGKGLQDTAAPTRAVSQAQVNGLVSEVLPQGCWRDDDYLWLTDRSRRLVEFTDGYLELLPMPSRGHQRVLAFLFMAFRQFLAPAGGEALFAPLRLRVREGMFREPDLLAVRHAQDPRSGNRFWTGADVVAEVVSPDGEERDLIDKRSDYAEAAIPSTGSSIHEPRPSPSSSSTPTGTSSMAHMDEETSRRRRRLQASTSTSPRFSMPQASDRHRLRRIA